MKASMVMFALALTPVVGIAQESGELPDLPERLPGRLRLPLPSQPAAGGSLPAQPGSV